MADDTLTADELPHPFPKHFRNATRKRDRRRHPPAAQYPQAGAVAAHRADGERERDAGHSSQGAIAPAYPYTSGLRVKRNRHPMMAAAAGWEHPAALAYRFTQASSRPMCRAAASRPHQSDGAALMQAALGFNVGGVGCFGGLEVAQALGPLVQRDARLELVVLGVVRHAQQTNHIVNTRLPLVLQVDSV